MGVRQRRHGRVTDIDWAILEPNGKISFIAVKDEIDSKQEDEDDKAT